MEALDLLLHRSSQPRLQAPAPAGEGLENIMQAALRAPDHACLRPWHFIVCQNEGLHKLGRIFEKAAYASEMDEKSKNRAAQLPLRAPMVIVVIAKYTAHEKVPWVEQVASASCAAHAMQMAAVAQGFGGVWRTGAYAQNEYVKQAFELAREDEIVGFLYLGSTVTKAMPKPKVDSKDFFEIWD